MKSVNRLLRGDLSDLALEIAATGFAALWNGQATRPDELVPGRPRDVRQAMTELVQRGRAEVDDQGRLVGIHGLTLRPSRHNFVHAGRTHSTWCAFDCIGIPAALGINAEAHTRCPACDQSLQVSTRSGRPEPSEVVLWVPSSDVGNLMADFCAAADLYCKREHLEQRVQTTTETGEVFDVATAAELGRTTWADVAGLGLAAGVADADLPTE
jgi:alkylmercury lyase